MNHWFKKENKTQIIRKSISGQKKNTIKEVLKDPIGHTLRQQLKKRQHVIEKMYKKSVTNKLYVFPKDSDSANNISITSHDSITEMDNVQRYQLRTQNNQSNTTVKNSANYFSNRILSHPNDNSDIKIDLRKFRSKLSNKKLINSSLVNIHYSARINPQRYLIKEQTDKRKQQYNSTSSCKDNKTKKYTNIYQQILSKVGIKVDRQQNQKSNSSRNIKQRVNLTFDKLKVQNSLNDSHKDRYRSYKEPVSNISVSKILEKYKLPSKKKDSRSRTEY